MTVQMQFLTMMRYSPGRSPLMFPHAGTVYCHRKRSHMAVGRCAEFRDEGCAGCEHRDKAPLTSKVGQGDNKAEWQRQYYQKMKALETPEEREKRLAYQREYYRTHREQILAARRVKRDENGRKMTCQNQSTR